MGRKHIHQQGWIVSVFSIGIIMVTGLNAPVSEAAWPDTSAFKGARELSNAELKQERGRFIDKGQIMFFGVQMSTEWRTSTGEVLQAQADLMADVSTSTPKVKFSPTVTAMTLEDYQQIQQQTSNRNISISNGSNGTRGVAQTIQVGGDFNRIANQVEFDISDDRGNRISNSSGNGQSNLTTASGSRLSVTRNNDGIGMAIAVPNHGRVSQEIRARQGLRQAVQVQGNLQQIRNVTRLHVQVRQQSTPNTAQVGTALQSLRQLNRL